MKRIFLSILVALIFSFESSAQNFSIDAYNLNAVFSKITHLASEEDNIKNNKIFIQMLDSVLHIPESFKYPFLELKMGNLIAPDQTFRIFTWHIVHTNGTYETFGLLQQYFKETNTVEVYQLIDNATTMRDPTRVTNAPDNWYGAVYYDLRAYKYDDVTTYILLGWRPNNIYTQKKVIETFRFDKKGKPSFGYQIIEQKGSGYKKRIIFEYSSKQIMMLRYEKKKKMYVLDHLAPSDPRYEGIFEFYGPDFSVDGYKYKQGKFQYISDIDLHSSREKFSDYIPEKLKRDKKKETSTGL